MGYKLKAPIYLSDLSSSLGYQWSGFDVPIESVSSASDASTGDIFFSNGMVDHLNGVAVICGSNSNIVNLVVNGAIFVDNPRLEFIKILSWLIANSGVDTWSFSSSIHSSVTIGSNVVIEDGCFIDANSIIEHNVVIHTGTRIGYNTRIRAGSVIGGDGFGFERDRDGTPFRFPHLGGVVIGDNVEIGALNSIARGTLSDTRIGDNVKTDNLVHVAHNCKIGKGCIITACAELSGGVGLGENVWVGPNSSFMQKVSVGSHSLISLGSVVTKNVAENIVVAGSPARKIRNI